MNISLKMLKLETILVIAAGLLGHVEGSEEKVWAILGRPASLDCRSPKETCLWRRPDSNELLSQTSLLTRSRYSLNIEFYEDSCHMELRSVDERDLGEWTCVDGSGEQEVFGVSLALEPGSVHLETDSMTFEVRCVVARARPRPEFMWYLDDVLLEEIEKKDFEDSDSHYQSLVLNQEAHKKHLRCVISHVSLEQPKEASLILNFLNDLAESKSKYIVDIFVGVFAMVLLVAFFIVLLAWAKNWQKSHERARAEAQERFQNLNSSGPGFPNQNSDNRSPVNDSRFVIIRLSEMQLNQHYGHVVHESEINK